MAKRQQADKKRAKKRKERERRLRRETNVRRNNAPLSPIEDLPDIGSDSSPDSPLAAERALRALDERPSDPREAAQELAYRAMEATSRSVTERLARQAVELDPDCADGLAMLALLRREPDERIEGLERALAAAERALGGPEFLAENAGHFWGLLETRPYMRTRYTLAEALHAEGRSTEAAGHYRGLLDLNRNDNLGVRDHFLGLLLEQGDLTAARGLLSEYPEDASALFAWGRVVERILSGDRPGAARALRRARRQNRHVERGLLGKRLRGLPDGSMIFGEESEGAHVVQLLGPVFDAHDDAFEWLAEGGLETTSEERSAALESYGSPVAGLLSLGEPVLGLEWQQNPPTDLGADDVPELVRMLTDPALSELPSDSPEVWAQVHALRALGHLRAAEAVAPLIASLEEESEDEYLMNDLYVVLAMIGSPSVPELTRVLRDEAAHFEARSTAAEALAELARRHPAEEPACLDPIVEQLGHYRRNHPEFNANLIWEIVSTRGERHLDLVKEVFDVGRVDEQTCGDWDQILAEAERSSGARE